MHLIRSITNRSLRQLPSVLPKGLLESINSNSTHSGRSASVSSNSSSQYSQVRSPTSATAQPIPVPRQYTEPLQQVQQAQIEIKPELISPQDRAKFDSIFDSLDQARRGVIGAQEVVPFLTTSNLSEEILAQIWDLADINSSGQFKKSEFAIAMHLVQQQLMGRPLPQTLPASLYPDASNSSSIPPAGFQQFPQQQPQSNQYVPAPVSAPVSVPAPATPKPAQAANSSLNDLLSLGPSLSSPPPSRGAPRAASLDHRDLNAGGQIPGARPAFAPTSSFGQSFSKETTTPQVRPTSASVSSSDNVKPAFTPSSAPIPQVSSPVSQSDGKRLSSIPASAPVAPTPRAVPPPPAAQQQQKRQSVQPQPVLQPQFAPQPIVQQSQPPQQRAFQQPNQQPVQQSLQQQPSQAPQQPLQQKTLQPPPPPLQRQGSQQRRAPPPPQALFNEQEHANKLSILTAGNSNLTSQVNSMGDQSQEATKKREAAEIQLREVQTLKTDLESRLAALKAEHDVEIQKVQVAEKELQQLKTQTDHISSEYASLGDSYRASQARLKETQDQLTETQEHYRELHDQYQEVFSQLEVDQQENQALKAKIEALVEETAALNLKLAQVEKDGRQQKGLLAINKKQLAHAESDNSSAQTKLDEALTQQKAISASIQAPSVPTHTESSDISQAIPKQLPQTQSSASSGFPGSAVGAAVGAASGLAVGGAAVLAARHHGDSTSAFAPESQEEQTGAFNGSSSSSPRNLTFQETNFDRQLDEPFKQLDGSVLSPSEPTYSSVRGTVDTPNSSPPTSDFQYNPANVFHLPIARSESVTSSVQNNPPMSVRDDRDIDVSRPESPSIAVTSDPVSGILPLDDLTIHPVEAENIVTPSFTTSETVSPVPAIAHSQQTGFSAYNPDNEGFDDRVSSSVESFEIVPRVGSTLSLPRDSEEDEPTDVPDDESSIRNLATPVASLGDGTAALSALVAAGIAGNKPPPPPISRAITPVPRDIKLQSTLPSDKDVSGVKSVHENAAATNSLHVPALEEATSREYVPGTLEKETTAEEATSLEFISANLTPASKPIHVEGGRDVTPASIHSASTVSLQGSSRSLDNSADDVPVVASGAELPVEADLGSVRDVGQEEHSAAVPVFTAPPLLRDSSLSSASLDDSSPEVFLDAAEGARELPVPYVESTTSVSSTTLVAPRAQVEITPFTVAEPLTSAASVVPGSAVPSIASAVLPGVNTPSLAHDSSAGSGDFHDASELAVRSLSNDTEVIAPSHVVETEMVHAHGEFHDAFETLHSSSPPEQAVASTTNEGYIPATVAASDDDSSSNYDEEDDYESEKDVPTGSNLNRSYSTNDDFEKAFSNEGFAPAEEEVEETAPHSNNSMSAYGSTAPVEQFVSASSSPASHSYSNTPVMGISPGFPDSHSNNLAETVPAESREYRSVEPSQFTPQPAFTSADQAKYFETTAAALAKESKAFPSTENAWLPNTQGQDRAGPSTVSQPFEAHHDELPEYKSTFGNADFAGPSHFDSFAEKSRAATHFENPQPTVDTHFFNSSPQQTNPVASSVLTPPVPAQRPVSSSANPPPIPPKEVDLFDSAFDGLDAADEEKDEDEFNFGSATPFEAAFGKPSGVAGSNQFFGGASAFAPEAAPNVFDAFPSDNAPVQSRTGIPVSNDEWDALFVGFGAPDTGAASPAAEIKTEPQGHANNNGFHGTPVQSESVAQHVVKSAVKPASPNSQALNELVGMGFEKSKAFDALKKSNFNVENASNYLLDH